ncbi:MAG TPA: adenine methyltransferase [Flavobacteriales bacterium]|jgi:site-specific DNA-methyltransferase (adenine-specific)|nr:adenine methyltransferase [Flavobacteriales bacterium]
MNTKTQQVMFSSETDNWSTPQEFFDKLNWRFGPFDLDPCASTHNTKCANFFSEPENGLLKSWKGHTVFCNPPYGRGIDAWIKKGYEEGQDPDTMVVMLIPSRTDTRYWHEYVMKAEAVYFIKGRLRFGDSTNSAPFPSAVVVFTKPEASWAPLPEMGALNR